MEKVAVLIGIGGAGANTIERIKDKIKIESLRDKRKKIFQDIRQKRKEI